MPKKSYPGDFRLTLKTARALVVQEFGTAKGLEPDRGDGPGRVFQDADGEPLCLHPAGHRNERVHRGTGGAVYGKPYLCRLLQPGDAGAGL